MSTQFTPASSAWWIARIASASSIAPYRSPPLIGQLPNPRTDTASPVRPNARLSIEGSSPFRVHSTCRQYSGESSRDPEQIQRIRHEWGLDQPMYIQYGRYLAGLLRGDFGRSFFSNTPVAGVVVGAFRRRWSWRS